VKSPGRARCVAGAAAILTLGACSRDAAGVRADPGVGVAPTGLASIRYVGRFDMRDPAGPRFAWPGTALVAAFTGTGLNMKLRDSGTSFFSVVVDGGEATRLSTNVGTETYSVASGLAEGGHTVVLTKRTESVFGTVQLLSVNPVGGALRAPPPGATRRIEYVGDSITCGLGDLGAGPRCRSSAATEDETVAYGALAAASLQAEASVIAYSGIGLLVSPTGVAMPTLFLRARPDDPTPMPPGELERAPPDVVVVNLGTNDFARGDPGPSFESATVAFLGEELRGHYPNAYIICALSPMLTDAMPTSPMERSKARVSLQSAVRARRASGDTRVSYLEFDEQTADDGYGCDVHPSLQTHRQMATKLVSAIRSLTGW
jgi:lysophospholipase L1-like esterase